jgi:5'-nucleotidase
VRRARIRCEARAQVAASEVGAKPMGTAAPAALILVTNDDGYDAPGIAALAAAMEHVGQVVVVAPDRQQSASSHSLTIDRPLRVVQVGKRRFRVDGTPTDCVHLAIPHLTDGRKPDLVVSGINRGLNVGDDVTYSGTVAGALEGALLRVAAVAFSTEADGEVEVSYDAAAAFARRLAADVMRRGLQPGVLLNVNFPRRPARGVRITRQAATTHRSAALERRDPSGRPYYWIASQDTTPGAEPDGDHAAIAEGFVSITPLHANLTHERSLRSLSRWNLELP